MEKKIKIWLIVLAIGLVLICGMFILNKPSVNNERYCEKNSDCVLGYKIEGLDKTVKTGCYCKYTKGINILSDEAIASPTYPFSGCKCENNTCVAIPKPSASR